jgi:hypothetical protein
VSEDEHATHPRQPYEHVDWNLNYRKHPEQYRIGIGQFGVMKYEPYTSEVIDHWRYKSVPIAIESRNRILALFYRYLDTNDFPGADVAKKALHMGFTRALRYAKPVEKDVSHNGSPPPAAYSSPEKRRVSLVFKDAYDTARTHECYQRLRERHQKRQE